MNDLVLASKSEDPMLAAPLPQAQRRGTPASPRDLLFVLFWHRRKVVTFFCVALLLTAAAVLSMPSRYLSESTLLNKLGSETVSPDATASLGGAVIQPVIQREMQMKTELEVLKSNEIAQAVVRKVSPAILLRKSTSADAVDDANPLFKQALLALKQNLNLDVVPDSNVLKVGYESSDPKLAQAVVNAYVNAYLIHRNSVYSNAKSATFLSGERTQKMKLLTAMEDKIRAIKDEAGVGNIDEQRVILQAQIGTLQTAAAEARTARLTAEAQTDQLALQLKSIPPTVIASRTHNQAMNWIDELKKDTAKLEQELNDANARYLPNSPQVQILQDKIAGNRKLLAGANDNGGENIEAINPTFQELTTRLQTSRVDARTAQAKESAVQAEIATADGKLKRVNEVEQKIKAMTRNTGLSEDTLKLIAQAADRAELQAAFAVGDLNTISVVQPATFPLRPVAPNRLMLLVVGVFVAASGAVGLGIAAETLSRSTKRPEDIDKLSGLPCVSVPVVEEDAYLGRPATTAKNAWTIKSLLLPGKARPATQLVTRAAGTNVVSGPRLATGTTDVRPVRRWSPQLLTAAHGIVDGLLFDAILKNKQRDAFVTGIVSCRPGQGASTLGAYVASAIADRLEASMTLSMNDQVLLIDADLSEPTQHRTLGVPESPGLGDWLMIATDAEAGIESFVHPTNHGRLSLMPAGRASGMARLLDRMDRLFAEVTQTHRHVVVDLPPVSTTPTALRLAAKCDAVLLVVECGNLHQEVVRRSVRALQGAGANVAGVILNKRRFPIPDWLYERAA